eukprot:Skav232793  [mRNA]  locus=scaffold614:275004:280346:+ [translate_table: standard]
MTPRITTCLRLNWSRPSSKRMQSGGSRDLLRWSTMQLTSMRRQIFRLFVGTFAIVLLCQRSGDGNEAFVPVTTGSHESLTRRGLLGAALPAVLGGPGAATAMTQGITDVVEYMNRRKRELVPYMKQGMDYLESHEIDERMLLFLPKMARKMEAYAGLQSRGAAPDKNTYRLNASVRAFEKAIKAGDKKAALEAFQKYQDDIPEGIGRFDIHKPETFEGPKDVNLPAAT